MNPPSLQLLRALRTTAFGRASIQARWHASHSRNAPLPASTSCPAPLSRSSQGVRDFSATSAHWSSPIPKSADRGPQSQEDTQTDFGVMDVLGNTAAPTTAIDACLSDGFLLDNGLRIIGGCGCLLVAGEAFSWRPWEAGIRPGSSGKGRMINKKGQWDVEKEAWGVLELVWPKPGMSCVFVLGISAVSQSSTRPVDLRHITDTGI